MIDSKEDAARSKEGGHYLADARAVKRDLFVDTIGIQAVEKRT